MADEKVGCLIGGLRVSDDGGNPHKPADLERPVYQGLERRPPKWDATVENRERESRNRSGKELRGWRCVHRHFYVTQLSHLFCARVRQEYDAAPSDEADRLSIEQIRSAMNVWLDSADLPPKCQRARFEKEQAKQQYYQRRSKQARVSHTKTQRGRLSELGIDADRIKSCLVPKDRQ